MSDKSLGITPNREYLHPITREYYDMLDAAWKKYEDSVTEIATKARNEVIAAYCQQTLLGIEIVPGAKPCVMLPNGMTLTVDISFKLLDETKFGQVVAEVLDLSVEGFSSLGDFMDSYRPPMADALREINSEIEEIVGDDTDD